MSQQGIAVILGVLAVLGHRLSGSDAAWRCNRQESDRAGWVRGRPLARGAGGPHGSACGRAGSRADARVAGIPKGMELRGRQGCSLAARMPGRNLIKQDGRGRPHAREAGGPLGVRPGRGSPYRNELDERTEGANESIALKGGDLEVGKML